MTREDPILVSGEKLKRVLADFKQSTGRPVRVIVPLRVNFIGTLGSLPKLSISP